jgi:hypothetical protein
MFLKLLFAKHHSRFLYLSLERGQMISLGAHYGF